MSARTGLTLWQFAWDANGLVSVTDFDGDVTRVERDGSGNAQALVAQDGQRTVLTLDGEGRAIRVTDATGRFVEAAYEANGLMKEWKDANGNATAFTWDSAGNLLTHTNARAAKMDLRRTSDGVEYTSPEGRLTQYLRKTGGSGTLLTMARPEATQDSRRYQGQVHTYLPADGTFIQVEMQAGAGNRFGRAIDVPGRVFVRTPDGLESTTTSVRTSSNAPDDVLAVTEEVEETRVNGALWRSRLDVAAKTYEASTPAGRTVTATLDGKLRPVTVTVPGVLPVTYGFDARGRIETVTQGARSQRMTYGPDGYLATTRNALGETTAFTTDATGRLTKVTRADTKEVGLTQDGVGNLTGVTPADRQAHNFSYSKANEAVSYTPPAVPGSGAETMTYDLDGLVTKSGHADGSETLVLREPSGRVTAVATPWWRNEWTYLGTTGQVKTLTRGAQKLEWTYDGFLMKEEKASGVAPGTSQWSYDADFRVATHTVGGTAVAFGYDGDSLLTSVGTATLTRLPATGQLASLVVGSVTTDFTHNPYGELATVATRSGSTGLYSEGLSYDNAGRLTVVEEVVEGVPAQWVYGHDALGRLTSAAKNGAPATTWSYDGNGNRLTEDGVASTFDAQDRLLTKGSTAYTWDGLGGRLTKTEGGQVTRYVHDGLGALQSVTVPDGTVVAYEYDGRQRRVAKKRNGVVVKRWLYDGQYRVTAEVDSTGAVTSRFVYGSQGHSPDYVVQGGVTYAYVKSHLGSIRLVVNAATGAVAQRRDYDAWGNVLSDSAPGFQPFAFAGGVYDADTKLTHFGYRDYDANSGGWTSKDPIRLAGGLNAYSYALNSPVGVIDSTGLNPAVLVFVPVAVAVGEALVVTGVVGAGIYCIGTHCLGDLGALASDAADGLIEHLDNHLAKLEGSCPSGSPDPNDPDHDNVQGWRKEVRAAIKNLRAKLKRMPNNKTKRAPVEDAIRRAEEAASKWGP